MPSEETFSAAGNIIQAKRTNLATENADQLKFINHNLKHCCGNWLSNLFNKKIKYILKKIKFKVEENGLFCMAAMLEDLIFFIKENGLFYNLYHNNA